MDTPPIQYARTSDGFDIAYMVSGTGRPLVLLPWLVNDIKSIWTSRRSWMDGFASRFRLVQFDFRGRGLSSRGLSPGHRNEDYETDLAAVVDKLALERFVIFANGGFGHTAVRYTVAHPDRVEALILNTTPIANTRYTQSMTALAAENWEYFIRLNLPPGLDAGETNEWLNRWLNPATYEDWNIMAPVSITSNIEAELPRLQAPVLVLHSTGFPIFGPTESIKLAASIRNARLVMIDGNTMSADAAEGLAAIDSFIAELPPEVPRQPAGKGLPLLDGRLSMRENQVLKLVAEGKSNKEIAAELVLSVRTVERHIGSIYAKTGVRGRVAAAAHAQARTGQ